MNTFGQRLTYVLTTLDRDNVEESLGVSRSTINRLLRDAHPPSAELLTALVGFGWSASWLLTGKGDARVDAEVIRTEAPAERGDYVYVPRYSIRGALGLGIPIESEQVVDWLAFRRQFLVFLGMSPDKGAVIRVSGDSMYPDLQDGDTVLVDLTDRKLPPRGSRRRVFAVHLNDGGLVVKFAHTFDDQVHLVSASPEYPEIAINPVECTVVGRVRWFGRTLLDGTL
jgi:phage repressor protein C with HTH and peptisase S24 domain